MTGDDEPVVVIGAGMAGLAAARDLRRARVPVVVLEAADRVGGRVQTVNVPGPDAALPIRVDVGAQFVSPFQTKVLEAIDAVGLGPRLVERRQRAAVVHAGRAWRIDSLGTLMRTPLLPPSARARLPLLAGRVVLAAPRLDPQRPLAAAPLDVRSARALVAGLAGEAVADRLIAPVVRGLLYWDLEETSQAMLLLLLRVALRSRRSVGLAGGLAALPEGLTHGLDVRLRTPVTAVRRRGPGWSVAYPGGDLPARAVVCATTADVAARLVADLPGAPLPALHAVRYTRTAVVTVRVPPGRRGPAATLLFTRESAPHLAALTGLEGPADRLARVFLSDDGAAALGHLDDAALAAGALDALRVSRAPAPWADGAEPLHVHRWAAALPVFDVGSLAGPLARRPDLLDRGTLVFCGDYIGGPHLEGAVTSGQHAAARVLRRLR